MYHYEIFDYLNKKGRCVETKKNIILPMKNCGN